MDQSGYSTYQPRGRGRGNWRGRGNRGYQNQRNPRSFSQMRNDNRADDRIEESKIEDLRNKTVEQDEAKIAKNNPKKETPQLDSTKVKLDSDVNDWIEKRRANIEVTYNPDFEDELIRQHSKQFDYSTVVLQYNDKEAVKKIKNVYEAYSTCNVAYRLLMTLPKSIKREISDLLLHLTMGEQPRNTPLMAEMCAHIGKHKNEAYGNIRIDGHLLEARRKIIKAMAMVAPYDDIWGEFKWQHHTSPDMADVTKEAVWDDADSLGWLKRRAISEFENLRKNNYSLGTNKKTPMVMQNRDELAMQFSVPYIELHDADPQTGGKWQLSADDVKYYYYITKEYEKNVQDQLMAIMLIMHIDLRYFRTVNVKIKDHYAYFSDSRDNGIGGYANATMSTLLEYIGLQSYKTILDDDDLIYNYNIIQDAYSDIADPTVRTLFKTVPISRDEFGDESQIMTVADTSLYMNPKVESAFKIKDAQKIGAAAIFTYAKNIAFKVADYTILRRKRKAIISELVGKYSVKDGGR